LRTRENVLRLIDPAIVVRAFENEAAAAAAAEPERERQPGHIVNRNHPALVHARKFGVEGVYETLAGAMSEQQRVELRMELDRIERERDKGKRFAKTTTRRRLPHE